MGWETQAPQAPSANVQASDYKTENIDLIGKVRIQSVSISLNSTGKLWGNISILTDVDDFKSILAELINGQIVRMHPYRQKRLTFVLPTPLEIYSQQTTRIQFHVFNNNEYVKNFTYAVQYQRYVEEIKVEE